MGFMDFLGAITELVVTSALTVFDTAQKATKEIIGAATKAYQNYKIQREENRICDAESQKSKAGSELREINNELLHLMNKHRRNGGLSESDRRRVDDLSQRRREVMTEIANADKVHVAEAIATKPDAFAKWEIDDTHAHILQGQVGVSFFGKRCPRCGREMVIQWRRDKSLIGAADFFWGCTGYYHILPNGGRACTQTVRVTQADLNIFTRSDIPEVQLPNADLTGIVMMPEPKIMIENRLDQVVADQRLGHGKSDDYRCPVHGEPLVLRKKSQPDLNMGLMGMYFLGCRYWRPNNNGCNYVVTLKSPMQLAELLRKETGTGIL